MDHFRGIPGQQDWVYLDPGSFGNDGSRMSFGEAHMETSGIPSSKETWSCEGRSDHFGKVRSTKRRYAPNLSRPLGETHKFYHI